jgi:hypothetical protein
MTGIALASAIASGGTTLLLAAAGGAIGYGFSLAGASSGTSAESPSKPASVVQDSLIDPNGRVSISTPRGKIVPDANDSIITTLEITGVDTKPKEFVAVIVKE